jgi:hypothetical protein
MRFRFITIALFALLIAANAAADTTYRPFVLASVSDDGLEARTQTTLQALKDAGFRIAGTHGPVADSLVIVATSDELLAVAAASDRGGYAAAQRISVTERNGRTEVAYVNPLYLQYAYRLEADMQPVADALAGALGSVETFGSEKGLTAKKLGKYNYMIGMQKFDDRSELGRFGSFEEAVAAVSAGLAQPGDALSQVYRIDIPGKQQAVIGVAMKATNEEEQPIDEAFQLSIVDFEGYAKTAYFPYEILVSGDEAEALHMRFRMAVHFPDLPMMGAHGFTKLMSSPGATEEALERVVTQP